MERHDSYKPSEIDWVGDIPSHWETVQPKYKLSRVTRPPEEEDEVVTCFRDGVVTLRKNRREDGFTNSLKEHGYQQIRPGDLVVHEMDGFAGAIGISDSKGKSTPVYTVIEPDGRTDLRYISYLLREMSKTGKIESLARSIRERTTDFRWNMWSVIHFPFPPSDEQNQISDYLDRKTLQIDDLIEKTERKIKLLKEQRSSLINQCVTKGLDPNVEMKDSGVEWIGEMPEHWSLSKLKYETDLIVDGTHFTPNYQDDGVPFLRVTDLLNDEIDRGKTRYISRDEHETLIQRCCPQKGDLLLSKNGTIGRTKVVDWDWEFSIFVSLCLIRLKDTYSPDLLSYFFQSALFDTQISEGSKQSTVTNLHLDKIREFILINSPIEEQFHIVSHLDKETSKVDQMVDIETKRIELLKEYRQSLISNVVTGKIDVREEVIQ